MTLFSAFLNWENKKSGFLLKKKSGFVRNNNEKLRELLELHIVPDSNSFQKPQFYEILQSYKLFRPVPMGFSDLQPRLLTNICTKSFYHFPTRGWSNTVGKYAALKIDSFLFFKGLIRK